LVIGINRWSYRLVLYVALMTDRYPPSGWGASTPRVRRNPVRPSEASQ
jgi:hypothetical protein